MPKKARGRRSKYTKATAEQICSYIIQGYTLRNIEAQEGMPHKATMLRWLAGNRGDFRDQYAMAKELQADLMAEEIIDIADDGTNDWVERKRVDGSTYTALDNEHIMRSTLRVNTRKWTMSKLIPKKYGERITQNLEGGISVIRIDDADATL